MTNRQCTTCEGKEDATADNNRPNQVNQILQYGVGGGGGVGWRWGGVEVGWGWREVGWRGVEVGWGGGGVGWGGISVQSLLSQHLTEISCEPGCR